MAAGLKEFVLTTADGEFCCAVPAHEVFRLTKNAPVLVCNRSLMRGKLGRQMPATVLDVLELFAFVCPARNVVPTAKEIAAFLNITMPANAFEEAKSLFSITRILLSKLAAMNVEDSKAAAALAITMNRDGGWIWGADVLAALGRDPNAAGVTGLTGFAVWNNLTEWQESAPEPPAGTQPVEAFEAERKLKELLAVPTDGFTVEDRADQFAYAKTVSKAFAPRADEGVPVTVLAQAGTGIGKTLGYLAPTGVWSDKNAGTVWISTFTRNLQRQLEGELSRLYPDAMAKRRNVVVRKGRENYLCLLNFAEAVGRIPGSPPSSVPLGLIARWIAKTKDGDLSGGDFPGWLADMLNASSLASLADQRGDCIYAQCPHYKKCFIEKVLRRSRHAKIVVANHALVMTQLAGAADEGLLPVRFVFDEGHQLFNAADDIFAGEINLREGTEMRRCLLGAEDRRHAGRAQGIRRRIEDLALVVPDINLTVQDIAVLAAFLPRSGALTRLKNRTPQGNFEKFLTQVYRQVTARAEKVDALYSLECEPRPVAPELAETAKVLYADVKALEEKVRLLIRLIEKYINDEAANIETADKQRYTAVLRSLKKTAAEPLAVWRLMLEQLELKTPSDFVDWLEITRTDGFDSDVGYHRHWIDPTFPFASSLKQVAHGVLITSATLTDRSGEKETDWTHAAQRTGVAHLNTPELPFDLTKADFESPFDYAENSRVLIITDVNKANVDEVAAAYRELFFAAQGGSLGIFTAIRRLKEVYRRIKDPLAEAGLPLLAQHVDTVNLQTLLDIFKAQEEACLLGTDAVRDGIDVPGKSLRMIVFDRVPWHRPSIAHKARKEAFGETGEAYNLMLVRMKLAQAFGRLIRKKDDKGVFVLLDRAIPSETLTAFPKGAPIEKLGLKDALIKIREFLGNI
ncbi:MAG: ATP-dependent DNA helicase [Alphaproteobacteria bacterium]|nr:ATP-dependent DNA helicase [Alphaproteobacteria bacterium]